MNWAHLCGRFTWVRAGKVTGQGARSEDLRAHVSADRPARPDVDRPTIAAGLDRNLHDREISMGGIAATQPARQGGGEGGPPCPSWATRHPIRPGPHRSTRPGSGAPCKPLGIFLADLLVLACVAAIGFTVALFVAGVAFPAGDLQDAAKMGVLLSFVAGGAAILAGRLARAELRRCAVRARLSDPSRPATSVEAIPAARRSPSGLRHDAVRFATSPCSASVSTKSHIAERGRIRTKAGKAGLHLGRGPSFQ